MTQQTFTDIEYANRRKRTKREEFLDMMDAVIEWRRWVDIIRPHYPKGERGRPPKEIEIMLRMFLLQCWYTLSDEGVEESINDSYAMRKFMGMDFMTEQVPDSTTLLHFRHLLEEHDLTKKLFEEINRMLSEKGLMMRGGTIADATVIAASGSTKNEAGKRDPEMGSTRKGSQYYFGMKAHVGVDAGSGAVHSLEAESASVHEVTIAHKLIREDDDVFYGDAAHLGLEKRVEIMGDEHKSKIDYRINRKRGELRKMPDSPGKEWELYIESRKSSVRSKVEYVFHIVKDIFKYRKVAYKGIKKNKARLYMLFGCANLYMFAKAGRLSVA